MPSWIFFDSFKTNTIDGSTTVDFDTDDIKVALITNANIPDIDVDDFFDDFEATEVSGVNYTAGGEALTTRTINESGGVVTFDADDVSWLEDGSGFADARHAILYNDTGTPSTSALVATMNMVVDKGNTTGDLTLEFDAAGLFTLSG